jgi:manganese-transporting P-type ATPase
LTGLLALSWLQEDAQVPDTDFTPNLVNTVCYLVNYFVQLSTFAANYMGHPFNTAIRENKGLWACLVYSSAFMVLLTLVRRR